MGRRNTYRSWHDTDTPPLFKPDSAWRPPKVSDLPSWKGVKRIGLDTETQDDDLRKLGPGVRRGGRIVGISFAIEDGPKFYLPYGHRDAEDNLNPKHVLDYMRDNAKVFKGSICGANLGYDLDYLAEQDITYWDCDFRDIQVAEPLLNENRLQYSLDAVAKIHGFAGKNEAALRDAASAYGIDPKKHMWKLPARYVGAYAEDDADLPLKILRKQERLIEDQGLNGIYDLERRVQPILVRMRRHGVRIDFDHLERVEAWTIQQEQMMLDEIFRHTNVRICLDEINKKTLTARALDAAGLPYDATPTGQPKINTALLMPLAKDNKVASAIIHAKYLNKLRNTFVKSIRSHETNGRIHATLNQLKRQEENTENVMGAGPGRMSSSNPNCFSSDTEVLTSEGWKLFKDITKESFLGQYYKGSITFSRPVAVICQQYNGKMVHVHGPKVDLLMTPTHRCLLASKAGNEKMVSAKDYKNHLTRYQIHSGIWDNGITSQDAGYVRLAVAVQADASLRATTIRFYFSNTRKADRLRSILKECGISPRRDGLINSHTPIEITIEKTDKIMKYLTPSKEFSRAIVACSIKDRISFLSELSYWDGTRSEECTKTFRYFTTSRKSADIVSEVAALSAWKISHRVSKTKTNKPFFDMSLCPATATRASGFKITEAPYDGDVYCVTMPKSTVVVRRNGKYCVTGNCQQQPGRKPNWWALDVPVHIFWRKIYLPDDGGQWAAMDYSGQEPRMLTHFSALCNCPGADVAVKAAWEDPKWDFHNSTTELAFGATPGNTDPKEFKFLRGRAKIIFLGLVYGMGGGKLCRSLGFPVELIKLHGEMREVAGPEGKKFLEEFNRRVPFLQEIKKLVEAVAWNRRHIITLGGRHIHYEPGHGNERKALNNLIQGSSADQTKIAMVNIYDAGYTLQLQVHDEFDTTVYDKSEAEGIADIMINCVTLKVPSKVDIELGKSWGHSMEAA